MSGGGLTPPSTAPENAGPTSTGSARAAGTVVPARAGGEGFEPPGQPGLDTAEPGAEGQDVSLSLRAQLTIWFALSYGVILATIVAGLIVLDGGNVFQPTDPDRYDWLIRLVGIAFLAALAGGVAAAWVIVGAALEPLRRITAAAKDVTPDRIDESRMDIPEVGVEVNEARRELNRALDRIEAGYQSQERFISNVSHELKTPIAVVLTEARRLRMRERSQEELQEFVDDIADEMARLGKMVESFLTLARIDYEERLQKNEEFWFHDLLVEAVSRSRAQALAHEVHIDLALPEDADFLDRTTWGDPELMSSLVENLIRNAIRFSPRGSRVSVSLRPSDDQNVRTANAVVQVGDQGPGMPEELIAKVFEPFRQANTERVAGRGTGLGLAIAHKITELHRGSIRAFNSQDDGSGCVLEVQLPFLAETDWSGDRSVTAEIAEGAIGSGITKPAPQADDENAPTAE